MVLGKKLILFAIFVVFPFGKLFQFGNLSLLDIFILLFVLLSLAKIIFKIPKYFWAVFSIFSFSIIFCSLLFGLSISLGLLYLLRTSVYLLFWVCLEHYLLENKHDKVFFVNSLLIILIFIGIFGWLQYIFMPDFRPLLAFGWDEHYLRLIGTFLDPGFTSIFMVFGFCTAIVLFKEQTNKKYLLLSLFFLLSLAFTYSRAGFVALLFALIYFLLKSKKLSYLLIFVFFASILLFLPKGIGEGTKLLRTYSINQRISNTLQGIEIAKASPLFGVGYNNLCEYKSKYLKVEKTNHACAGMDNSIVFILVTTGAVGLVIMLDFLIRIYFRTSLDVYGELFKINFLVLLVHAQFNNSIFYPWVLVFIGILYSLSRKEVYSE